MELRKLGKRRSFRSLVGQRFGRLEVVEYLGSDRHHNTLWLCRCECGQEKRVHGPCLKSGNTISCGCVMREKVAKRSSTHGCARVGRLTPEFRTWVSMRFRCRDTRHANYGGRGIRVCDRWDQSFEAFLQDMGPRPSDQHSLDRIDVNGDYEPHNCRWATVKQQLRNKRGNRLLTCRGETKTLAEWCEITGQKWHTITGRIMRGWGVEDAIFRPVDKRYRSRFKGDKRVECV